MKPVIVIAEKSEHTESGSARTVMLALVSFLAGIAVTALWFRHTPASGGNTATAVSQAVPETAAPEPVGVPAPPPPSTPAPSPGIPQPADPAVIEQVKKEVPNFASISLDEGEQILRAAALKQFADATAETDDEIKHAQQQLQDAENNGSAAEQQAAMKNVQNTQSAASEKLKQIAASLQDQIAALKSLKGNP